MRAHQLGIGHSVDHSLCQYAGDVCVAYARRLGRIQRRGQRSLSLTSSVSTDLTSSSAVSAWWVNKIIVLDDMDVTVTCCLALVAVSNSCFTDNRTPVGDELCSHDAQSTKLMMMMMSSAAQTTFRHDSEHSVFNAFLRCITARTVHEAKWGHWNEHKTTPPCCRAAWFKRSVWYTF